MGLVRPTEGLQQLPSVDEIIQRLRKEAEIHWRREADKRRLLNRSFIPLTLTTVTQHDDVHGEVAKTLDGEASWSTIEFQRACLSWFDSAPNRRLVICGEGGSGKTTIAILLTVLMARESEELTPLLVNLASWQPDREDFSVWIERYIVRNYHTCRLLTPRTNLSRTQQLIYSRKVLLVIDGFDEVAKASQSRALRDLHEFIPDDTPFLLLTRKTPYLRSPELPNASMVTIDRLPAWRVADFLTANTSTSVKEIVSALRQAGGPLAAALELPFFCRPRKSCYS